MSLGFDVEFLPGDMRREPRWCCWRYIERDGRTTKIPLNPHTRQPASSTDASTWAHFQTAVDCAEEFGFGLGYMLGDGWLGIDFDDVAEADQIHDAWVADWVSTLPTYAEYSPSGTGLHAICRGATLPTWAQNRRGGVEVYEKSRFFCVTGRSIRRFNACSSAQPEVDAVCRRYLTREVAAPVAHVDHSAEDWRLACDMARKRASEEDVCTALREKLLREGRHEKAARPDYIARTAASAIAHVGSGPPPRVPLPFHAVSEVVSKYTEQEPYVIDGVLRRGEVMALIAPPKCRKSFLMHDLAISTALGRKWFGEHRCERGRVLMVDNELTLPTVAFRIKSIMQSSGFHIDSIRDSIDICALREDDRDIDEVLEAIEQREPPSLVIFDALYMMLERDMDENSNADIARMVRKFRRFATRTMAACVLVHHSSKGSQASKESIDTGSGAGSLGRAVDAHMAIRRHAEEDTFRVDYNLRTSIEPEPHAIEWAFPRYRSCVVEDIEALEKPRKTIKI